MAKQSENSWWWLLLGFFLQNMSLQHESGILNWTCSGDGDGYLVLFIFDIHTYMNNDYWLRHLVSYIYIIYLSETNMHLKMDGWNTTFFLGVCYFRKNRDSIMNQLRFMVLKRWCFVHLIINHWITETLLVFQKKANLPLLQQGRFQQCWPSSEKIP